MKCPRDNCEMDVALNLDKKRWKDSPGPFMVFVCPKCYITASFEEAPEDVRRCDVCNKPMKEGYCIGAGEGYYCSKECMNTEMTDKEFEELYADGEGDSYWTEYSSILFSES